ncbi:hypothetical protein V493_04643 [Pseudogymnoascus sp. VKM F-4281 (FW-2241)]|nr:hypothetical protein V493_04643 [Pseudogymnoascus sp. VKM F-4281 (FW-2241)]
MSHLANALRQITKKSSNPNALIYQLQLQRAKQKYLAQEQLGDGIEGAVALGPPDGGTGEKVSEPETAALDREQQSGPEAAEGNNEATKFREADMEPARAHGVDGRGEGSERG